MRHFLLSCVLCLLPLGALAQDATLPEAIPPEQTERDRSYLTGLIEDNLSGTDRVVRIEGFAGALSSKATFETLTISDAEGVWITISEGVLSWNRSAILSGRIEINELSAAAIDLPRLPVPAESTDVSPEVRPFALPELPVSVDIGKVRVEKVTLGEALFGEAAEVSLDGSMTLNGGEGDAQLAIARVDDQRGKLTLTGRYANTTRQLELDLLVDEAKDGIAANLIGLPGRPAITLAVAGAGPIDDFTADIILSTDGVQRLTGQVSQIATLPEGAAPGAAPERRFRARIDGDISPILPMEYRDFFGEQVSLLAEGRRDPTGATQLSALDIQAEALSLKGRATLHPNNMPQDFALDLRMGLADGQDVLLPVAGGETLLRSANLHLEYDQRNGDGWQLSGLINRLRHGDLAVLATRLNGSGRIRPGGAALPAVGGTIRVSVGGIETNNPALADAIGPFASLKTTFNWTQGQPLRLSKLNAVGRGYAANGNLRLSNFAQGIDLAGALDLSLSNLASYSKLAKRSLSGAAKGTVSGEITLLTGAFDGEAKLIGQDITLDQPDLDALLAGESTIAASAKRDETGLTIRALTAEARALTASMDGVLRSTDSDLRAQAEMSDLAVLGRGLRGGISVEATLRDENGARLITANGAGRNLGTGQAELNRLLAGENTFSLLAEQVGSRIRLRSFDFASPQLKVQAQGLIEDAIRRITLDARLTNTAILAPGFPGPTVVEGTVTDDGSGYGVDLRGSGPGGTQASVTGRIAPNGSDMDLNISGTTEAALANAFIAPRSLNGAINFDLRLAGAPRLQSLSGQIGAGNLRLVAPNLGLVLEDMSVQSQLTGGRANLQAQARLRSGGTLALSGPVTLSAPFDSDLSVTFNRTRFRDPELYDTQVSGTLAINGPLRGGARISGDLALAETELQVPSTGIGGAGEIPEITHVNEPAAVRTTRERAGLLGNGSGAEQRSGAAFPLDVAIRAERGIFVRGRGLDAELGGTLRVGGTTQDVIPVGEFNLIRGRLDILGKRFVLDQGRVALQGALIPWILFSASTQQDDYTTTISIEGRATEPEIRFTSSPELPEEEVLARLLFNRDLNSISPLQAAQLASAVATLAGKGGGGIVNRLRESTGLDDLDISTDAEGNTSLKAGKYISENLYTDVTVDSGGETEINLNLDLTPNLTARGSVDSAGQTGIGVFFEKDY